MFDFALLMAAAGATALLTVAICTSFEWIAPRQRVSLRERVPGAIMVFVGGSLSIMAAWPLQQAWKLAGFKGWAIPLHDWLAPLGLFGSALTVVAFFLCNDFFSYWRHRAEHKWFWPIHAAHHSPRNLHAATSIAHPLQVVPGFLFQSIPLSLIQVETPVIPVAVGAFAGLLEVYIHTASEVHFGPVRRLFVDNRFHRIHHSVEESHFDKNFGIMFSLWDGLFGTAHWPAKDEWPETGISEVAEPRTIRQFLVHPYAVWRQAQAQANAGNGRVVDEEAGQALAAAGPSAAGSSASIAATTRARSSTI